jgi:hypothetical protein
MNREHVGNLEHVDARPEAAPGPVKLSALVSYYARSFGGALYLYHVVIPALERSGRLVSDCEPYPAPVLYSAH